MFSRIPCEDKQGNAKLTSKEMIALDVDEVLIHGAIDDGLWGSPKSIESSADMQSWCEGLRDPHGGGGNILKQRKQQQQPQETLDASKPGSTSIKQTTLPLKKVVAMGPRKLASKGTAGPTRSRPVVLVSRPKKDLSREYLKKWKRNHDGMEECFWNGDGNLGEGVPSRSPSPIPSRSDSRGSRTKLPIHRTKGQNALDLGSSPTTALNHTRMINVSPRQETPSHWSPSPPRAPHRKALLLSEPEDEPEPETLKDSSDTRPPSPPPYPTPAQRPKPKSSATSPSAKPAESSRIPSSFGTGYPPTSQSSPVVFKPIPRKRSKLYPFNPGKILVPNSDSSQSQGRTRSLPSFPSQPSQGSQLPHFSQVLSYASDSQICYDSSQPGSRIPHSQLAIESRSTDKRHPTTRLAHPAPSSLVDSADAPRKPKSTKSALIQSDTESEPDGRDADDGAIPDASSDNAIEEEGLKDINKDVEEEVDVDELESDDERTDALIRQAEASVITAPVERSIVPISNGQDDIDADPLAPSTSVPPERSQQRTRSKSSAQHRNAVASTSRATSRPSTRARSPSVSEFSRKHQSADVVKASPSQPYDVPSTHHDPDTWRAPTFMRIPRPIGVEPVTKPTRTKRPAPRSSSPIMEEPRLKKAKVNPDVIVNNTKGRVIRGPPGVNRTRIGSCSARPGEINRGALSRAEKRSRISRLSEVDTVKNVKQPSRSMLLSVFQAFFNAEHQL
ncbi:hypothetical protein QCA50_003934 [Cerrena zonata]|uniref:Uncharacterized protein n=1 Tax=Cerrena zonata TaxID=2478898 RepID=A0AAW0GKH4_9APHY